MSMATWPPGETQGERRGAPRAGRGERGRDGSAGLSASPLGAGGGTRSSGGSAQVRGCCSAGAGAAVLHGAATFFTVKALREHNSSRPRPETARVNADSPGKGPSALWGFCEASLTPSSGLHRP